jgi:twitching motility two-component system response regulator PilH
VFARIEHLTRSGRLVVRQRTAEESLPAEPEHTAAEHAAIPDIAMPDPQDLVAPPSGQT